MHLDLRCGGESGVMSASGTASSSGTGTTLGSGSAIAVEVPGSGEGSRAGTASSAASSSINMEEFSPRCASRTETTFLQSPDNGSSSGTVSMVVDRSQTTLSRELCLLLLKLGELESDRAGVLGGGLIPLQSRKLSTGAAVLSAHLAHVKN